MSTDQTSRSDQLIEIGTIIKPHGVKGAVSAWTDASRDSALNYVSEIQIGPSQNETSTHTILDRAWMPKAWKLHFSDSDSYESANQWRGWKLFVRRGQLKTLPEDEFYIGDLIGCEVWSSETKSKIGKLTAINIAEHPEQQDTWNVTTTAGKEVDVPADVHYVDLVESSRSLIWLKNFDLLQSV